MSQPRRKVAYARLHQAYQQPGPSGLGNLKNMLCNAEQPGIEMWWTDQGLEVSFKGAQFIVPAANIVGATFAPAQPASAPAPATKGK